MYERRQLCCSWNSRAKDCVIERKDPNFKESRSPVFSELYLRDMLYLRKLLEGFMQKIHRL